MIHIVHGQDPACRHLLDTMYADRKRLFVDLLGWDVPVVAERFERDQFDEAHALYLIADDGEGGHSGSLHRPHILGSLFPYLCAGGVPTGHAIFEITRLCLPVRHAAAGRLRIRNQLISAIVDHALDTGIRAFTGVVDTRFLAQILAMGWRCSALSAVGDDTRSVLGGFQVEITADTPNLLASTGIYTAGTRATAVLPGEAAHG